MKKLLVSILIIISIVTEGRVLFKKHIIKDGSLKYIMEIEKEPYNRKTNMILRFSKVNNMAFLSSYYFTVAGAFGTGYALYRMGIDGDYKPSSCSIGNGWQSGNINLTELTTCCLISSTIGELLGYISGKIFSSESVEKTILKTKGLENLEFYFKCDKSEKIINKNIMHGNSYLKFNTNEFDIESKDKLNIEVYLDTIKILEYEYFPYDTVYEKRKTTNTHYLRLNRGKFK